MSSFFTKLFGGTKAEKDERRLRPLVEEINKEAEWASSLKKEEFPLYTEKWKKELQEGANPLSIRPKAFALAREASKRVLGEYHYDEQIMGALVLDEGSILEMKTGEGKTLTSVPAAYLNALKGKGVHIVTVNDYLAKRDSEWMGAVYSYLGLTTGVVFNGQGNEEKRKAYASDITYGTNNEFGFDYLRDNMKQTLSDKVQPMHSFAIVDEIDSILIDEARTPLIISGQGDDDTPLVRAALKIVPYLKECEKDPETGKYYELSEMEKFDKEAVAAFDEKGDFKIDEKNRSVSFTAEGMEHMEELLRRNGDLVATTGENGEKKYDLYANENFELVHYVTQAVKAQYLYKNDVDYIVKDGEIQIVDEFTGRILYGRRFSDGLHQAIEAKENVTVRAKSQTFATITFQNFFRMYDKLSGMTGTADTEGVEFKQIYNLDVVVIPTHRPVQRKDLQDLTFYDEKTKYNAIVQDIKKIHAKGQPVLVGTTSIEKSELLSSLLRREGIKHEVLNAKNHEREAYIIGEAGRKGAVTIATNMAGRGTDIKLGGSLEHLAMKKAGTDATQEELTKAKEEVLDEYKKSYEEVKALGGLYIIGSERHESRRIDNQLRGRSGRQGDPGTSQFYISLDDPLMKLFAKEGLKSMLGRLGMDNGQAIHHKMLDNSIEQAQKKVEGRNFNIRKRLLEYDDVLNNERDFIYKQRDEILSEKDLTSRVIDNTMDLIDSVYSDFSKDEERKREFVRLFSFQPEPELFKDPEKLKAHMASVMREKSSSLPEGIFDSWLRAVYLRNIDKRWVDHLDELEEIKENAGLQSYAQKNPLLEYKRDAMDSFDDMLEAITEAVCKSANNVRVTLESAQKKKEVNNNIQTRHADFRAPGKSVVASQAQSSNTTIRRTTPKVGRNDPCPCGSGKKYKQCCGRNA